jgi:hypothetical protein
MLNHSTWGSFTSITLLCACATSSVYAAGCENYPYSDGINVEDVDGGTKIVSTASVTVLADDVDSIKDARSEAILEAKAAISKFFNESIKSEEAINRVVLETKSMQGDEKENARKEVVERVKRLQNSSQALLRGAVVIGDCYSRGREVRASLGIKPETISSSSKLKEAVGDQSNSQRANQTRPQATGESIPRGVEEFSNTKKLKEF